MINDKYISLELRSCDNTNLNRLTFKWKKGEIIFNPVDNQSLFFELILTKKYEQKMASERNSHKISSIGNQYLTVMDKINGIIITNLKQSK